jgi:hypothetical protein
MPTWIQVVAKFYFVITNYTLLSSCISYKATILICCLISFLVHIFC